VPCFCFAGWLFLKRITIFLTKRKDDIGKFYHFFPGSGTGIQKDTIGNVEGNNPIWAPFPFLWRTAPILALFAKMRQICPSPIGRQRPLNRAGFGAPFYPSGPRKGCRNANIKVGFPWGYHKMGLLRSWGRGTQTARGPEPPGHV